MNGNSQFCTHCGTYHGLRYLVSTDEYHCHMGYECPKRGTVLVPLVKGLNLPVIHSKQWHKAQQAKRQQQLL